MTICMAPVYPATHPRHAPHTILVVTWNDDVVAAQGAGAVPEAMAREHGAVYDANELMLPMPVAARSSKMKMWVGNLDGTRQGLVIATSKEAARRIIGAARADFDGYWCEQPVDASLEPEVLYTRRGGPSGSWYRGRCPLAGRGEENP